MLRAITSDPRPLWCGLGFERERERKGCVAEQGQPVAASRCAASAKRCARGLACFQEVETTLVPTGCPAVVGSDGDQARSCARRTPPPESIGALRTFTDEDAGLAVDM